MGLTELGSNMTAIEALVAIVGVLISLSVASERLVEIIKGFVPFLNLQNPDEKKEGKRKAILQAMAVCSGLVTALLAKPALTGLLPKGWMNLPAIFALGFLASGGSGLWNAILSYVLNIKDMKKEEVKQLQKKNKLE
jgi:CDP-diglyceride synthetase